MTCQVVLMVIIGFAIFHITSKMDCWVRAISALQGRDLIFEYNQDKGYPFCSGFGPINALMPSCAIFPSR
jgi:hypothetical protein